MSNDEKELVRKRGQCKATITRVEKWLIEGQEVETPEDYSVRIEMIERAYVEFREIEDKLLSYQDQTSEIADFEDRYLRAKSQLRARVGRRESSAHVLLTDAISKLVEGQRSFLQESSDRSFSKPDGIKLPRMTIPPFSGQYSDFPSFKDLFEAAVHNNNSVTDAQKLQYLKGLLQGDAAALVKHIAVTDANYPETWEKVCQRYNKTKLIVNDLIKKAIDQPVLNNLNAISLRCMHDTVDEVIRGLKGLGDQALTRDPWVIYILFERLDSESKRAWAKYSNDFVAPTIDNFLSFLNSECTTLEACQPTTKIGSKRIVNVASVESRSSVCALCEGDHSLMKCDQFNALSVPDRRLFVSNKILCFNCLGVSHKADKCKSNRLCNICRRRHHTMLHQDIQKEPSNNVSSLQTNVENNVECTTTSNVPTIINLHIGHNFQSILPTAVVHIKDTWGTKHIARILLDSGSQASFITEACWKKLQTPRKTARFLLSGLATSNVRTKGSTKIILQSTSDESSQIKLDALIVEKLPSAFPSSDLRINDWERLQKVKLADPGFNKPNDIDILVGADKFFDVVLGERFKFGREDLTAIKTIFGWAVAGKGESRNLSNQDETKGNNTLNMHLTVNIDQSLRAFWEIEDIPEKIPNTPEELKCEEIFQKTVSRSLDGKFIVQLPFKDDPKMELGHSRTSAVRRLLSIEKRLSKNPELNDEYLNFMREYLQLGHMKIIPPEEQQPNQSKTYYLPHHPVTKSSSTTTKVRVVFDGSSKTSTGVSLNDKLLVGATIQPTLYNILLRFRTHTVAICGDIEKMYRQIWINKQDTNYQRIVWREQPNLPIQDYQLLTVTYGTAAAPFLATRTLYQLATECEDAQSHLSNIIRSDFYVDDLLTGAETINEAVRIKSGLQTMLASAGFNLRKWRSNISELNSQNTSEDHVEFEHDESIKILGLQWTPAADIFSFKVVPYSDRAIISKRVILSESSRIFDPLGWLSPSTIMLKTLFQSLWLQNLSWDDSVPDETATTWYKVRSEFLHFQKLQIPRRITQGHQMELHGFSDASERAYAAAVYCRSTDHNGLSSVQLVTAKTKVAPIKRVSIPRLELCGAQLLSKLMAMLSTEVFGGFKPKIHAWTDSTVVLAWLSDHPSKWKTFVGNRVAYIQEKIPRECWHYVPSQCNPADVASRGMLPSTLLTNDEWWHGPSWLKTQDEWPKQHQGAQVTEVAGKERKKPKIAVHQVLLDSQFVADILSRTSSWSKLIRIVGYALRFVSKLKKTHRQPSNPYLTNTELNSATEMLVKAVQHEQFSEEIKLITKSAHLTKGSKLASLAPFLDSNGVMRVGGRLQNATCSYSSKHPIILPAGHPLSKMIIQYIHRTYLHPGPSLTFHLVRLKYWIITGRGMIRKEIRNCVTCARVKPSVSQQMMGNLPEERVTPSRPFSRVGVDYAGPVSLLSRRTRGAPITKGYIAVFICLVTKAIHVEVASELSTTAFLNTFKRFSTRRGLPNIIFSDNGSNFIGAHRQLRSYQKKLNLLTNSDEFRTLTHSEDYKHIIGTFFAQNNIDWQFIPPSAPHFGGIWEAAVKSVKTHLTKATININLTFEEMTTLLCCIEAILNSRPMCALSTDDESYEALTPSHFLIGQPMTILPEPVPMDDDVNKPKVKIYDEIRRRVTLFWKRFQLEYLNNLNQRNKWRHEQENFKVGDLVIIKDKNLPTTCWPMARIQMVHPGKDALVRVVTVKTASSTFKRPITTICKLPVS